MKIYTKQVRELIATAESNAKVRILGDEGADYATELFRRCIQFCRANAIDIEALDVSVTQDAVPNSYKYDGEATWCSLSTGIITAKRARARRRRGGYRGILATARCLIPVGHQLHNGLDTTRAVYVDLLKRGFVKA